MGAVRGRCGRRGGRVAPGASGMGKGPRPCWRATGTGWPPPPRSRGALGDFLGVASCVSAARGVLAVVAEDGTACLANVRPMDAPDREDNPYKHRIQEVGEMDGKRLRRLVVRD